MTHAPAHGDLSRIDHDGFRFPLGVRPLKPITPTQGYAVSFEQADGGEGEGAWEEWPDRYVFDVVISADRLAGLVRTLFTLLPTRVYPILDLLGEDAHREVDPYIAYDLVGLDRFLEEFERRKEWLLEDGLVGFGALSEEPFFYVYVDEHKVVMVRCEADMRPLVERTLQAFDLEERDEVVGVDAVAHEHMSVLPEPQERTAALLPHERQLEELLDAWRLVLNVDDEAEGDDAPEDQDWAEAAESAPASPDDQAARQRPLIPWRLVIRVSPAPDGAESLYYEIVTLAGGRRQAIEASLTALRDVVANETGVAPAEQPEEMAEALIITADRLPREALNGALSASAAEQSTSAALAVTRLARGE